MKKQILLLVFTAIAVSFSSCQKESYEPDLPKGDLETKAPVYSVSNGQYRVVNPYGRMCATGPETNLISQSRIYEINPDGSETEITQICFFIPDFFEANPYVSANSMWDPKFTVRLAQPESFVQNYPYWGTIGMIDVHRGGVTGTWICRLWVLLEKSYGIVPVPYPPDDFPEEGAESWEGLLPVFW